MNVLAFFTNSGVPATGLSPTIRIIDIADSTAVISDEAMIEIGDGFYKYDFVAYDWTKDYAVRCDGGAALAPTDRYSYGNNDSFAEDVADAVWDEQISQHQLVGSFGETMVAILTDLVTIDGKIDIIKGLTHENVYIDQTVYDTDNNLIEARYRIYSDAASVGTNNNIIGEYQITSDTEGPCKFRTWQQIKV